MQAQKFSAELRLSGMRLSNGVFGRGVKVHVLHDPSVPSVLHLDIRAQCRCIREINCQVFTRGALPYTRPHEKCHMPQATPSTESDEEAARVTKQQTGLQCWLEPNQNIRDMHKYGHHSLRARIPPYHPKPTPQTSTNMYKL